MNYGSLVFCNVRKTAASAHLLPVATDRVRIVAGWRAKTQPDFWVLPLVLLTRLDSSRQIKRCHKVRAVLGDNVSQAGRRNATPEQLSLIRGGRYNRAKKRVPNAEGKNQHNEVNHQNDGQPTTAEQLSEQHGVTPRTIERDGKFAEAVEALDMEDETVAGKVVAPKAESLKRAAETVNVYSRIGIGKNGRPRLLVTSCH